MATWIVVFFKELKDSLRDKRSMTAAVMFAFVGPLFSALMVNVIGDRQAVDIDSAVAVIGEGYAPDLVAYLERQRFVLAEQADVVLHIPESYGRQFAAGETITLHLEADLSKSEPQRDARRLQAAIAAYAGELGQARLLLRGLSPSVVRPVVVQMRDQATPEARSSYILGVIVIYLLLAAFIASMPVAIDVSAGERERNSLEVLMAQPISAASVFIGKWLVAAVFGMIGVLLVLIVTLLTFEFAPLDLAALGMSVDLGVTTIARMATNLIPLALLAAAAQIVLAMYARTYKEASTYLNLLSFVPAAVAFLVLIKEWEPETWMYAVPLLGQQMMLRGEVRAEPAAWSEMALLAVCTLAVACAVAWFGTRLLRRETIIFGQGG